ncbi:MAG: tetraacyldisaccharide 4'-kinase [Candidatus Omnitrophica bacterium]|nr:tetraacyldisaccharide 4'-kinase [Candidatus Omnitrophota bacterium]
MIWPSLHDAWWRLATQDHPHAFSDALALSALRAGSLLYGAAVGARNAAYDRGWAKAASLPCRVISVGNLTVGGTGKTACVELIARKLAGQGQRVAVLSRGYGGSRMSYWLQWEQGRLLVNGAEVFDAGLADEPQLLARRLEGTPILVGPRRDRTGRLACEQFGAQVAILDDGFQHRRLRRDCDVVLVHARMPLGGWALFPRGPMREPMESLRRAQVVIVTKVDEAFELVGALSERLRTFNPDAALVTASHRPTQLLEPSTGARHEPQHLQGMRVGLVSSIGDPSGFEATIRRLQGTVQWHVTYPDHYRYQARDWAAMAAQISRSTPQAVVTTEKDWIRLQPWSLVPGPWSVPLWVLGVEMTIVNGERELDARLAGLRAR